jgi:hypothetical protein
MCWNIISYTEGTATYCYNVGEQIAEEYTRICI